MYFLDERFVIFVPLLVVGYWLARGQRNWALLAGSIIWLWMFSGPTLVALVGLTVAVVYPVARVASAVRLRDPTRANRIGWLGVVLLVGIASVLRIKTQLLPDMELSCPRGDYVLRWIGFSYFLLKAIHVVRATARGIVKMPSLLELLHYALFVPTLTSGPLYRIDTFATQLGSDKRLTSAVIEAGSVRIARGLAKKVVLVPLLASVVAGLRSHGVVAAPLAFAVLYVMLYLDFSGYCDIAIGIGRLLGFEVPENFKKPFTATTLTQFWRNWHATLGDWLRENVFIPLGGIRAKGAKLSLIVLGSMVIVGLWHSYTIKFVMWGAYHGALLLLENWLDVKPIRPHSAPWGRVVLRYALVQAAAIGGMFAFLP